jgi:hypothetical protein
MVVSGRPCNEDQKKNRPTQEKLLYEAINQGGSALS